MKRFFIFALLCVAAQMMWADWNEPRIYTQEAATGVSIVASTTGKCFHPLSNLFDGNKSTKWDSAIKYSSPGNVDNARFGYIIFAAEVPFILDHYTLTTGDDTKDNWWRNWKTWTVYGGSFEDDAAATAALTTNAGWTAVQHVENDSLLPQENCVDVLYEFSNSTSYPYYKLHVEEVVESHGEHFQQMSEMSFDWPEDFTLSVTGWEGVYNSVTHGIHVTPSREVPGLKIRYSKDGEDYSYTSTPTFLFVGEYEVYFRVSAPGYYDVNGSAKVVIKDKETPTGVEEVTGDGLQVTEKIFRDGQLFINRDGKTYTVTGTEVR
jgi:hypothetical protein